MTRRHLVDAITAVAVVIALVVSGAAVGREFFPAQFGVETGGDPALAPPTRSLSEPGLLRQLATTGRMSSDAGDTPAVTIIEFSDFQCQFCRGFAGVLRETLRDQKGKVALAYHHFPLEAKHPHAFNAAIAFECAREQGRGQAMHDVLFDRQAEIGRSPWAKFAAVAGIPDRVRFDTCLRSEEISARVRADMHLARALGMDATPTLLIGRAVVVGAITPDSLRKLLRTEQGH